MGILYIFVQNYSYMQFFKNWSKLWIKNTKSNIVYGVLTIIAAIASLVGTIGVIGVSFYLFWKTECLSNQIWLAVMTSIIVLYYAVTLVLTCFRKKPKREVNMVSTGLFALYTSYYFFSGLASNTEDNCSPL